MQFTGELTLGAVGIIVSILCSAAGGIGTVLAIYVRTRSDIGSLQIGHADLKADIAEVRGDVKTLGATFQKQEVMLERIAARQELMGAMSNLPNDLAVAMGKLIKADPTR